MRYYCLACGYEWNASEIISGYRQCPVFTCRSYDVVPASFPQMVEIGRQRGISHNTPLLDFMDAFSAVWSKESMLQLGFKEFHRVMKRVIQEIENPKPKKSKVDISVDREEKRSGER